MRDYYCYLDERDKGKRYTPEFWVPGMEGYRWFEKNVYRNQVVRKDPPARSGSVLFEEGANPHSV